VLDIQCKTDTIITVNSSLSTVRHPIATTLIVAGLILLLVAVVLHCTIRLSVWRKRQNGNGLFLEITPQSKARDKKQKREETKE
jgi:hypothetical protein